MVGMGQRAKSSGNRIRRRDARSGELEVSRIDLVERHGHSPVVKRKRGQPLKPKLHPPEPEVVKALAMPKEKRCKKRNKIFPHWRGRATGGECLNEHWPNGR